MLLMASLIACSSHPGTSARDTADANDTGRTLAPSGEGERTLLAELSVLPSGTARRVGEATVVAEAAYVSASGRTCRALHLKRSGRTYHRLACNDGKLWFFVPDVFGNDAAAE